MMARFIFFWLVTFGAMSGVSADDMRPGYLEIREVAATPAVAHQYKITWKAPIRPGLAARVVPIFPDDCTATQAERSINAAALLARWAVDCKQALAGRTVRMGGIEDISGDALMRYQSATGITQAARFTPDSPAIIIAQKPDRLQVARTYFVTGVEHILMGYDHLLFVLCLVLLLNGAWRVVATVTAFTVAHSLTLVATTLELISVPRAPVEAAIALSIVFLAVEIVKRKPGEMRLSERLPWVVAFLFGLLHGFGFAGALAEIGLPQGEVPVALLTFNLGVEAGQLVIVSGFMLFLWILRRFSARYLPQFQKVGAYAIGCIAAMWLLQRIIA